MNSTFSASYIEMNITFDALDRFQENKVFQIAQTTNNILKSKQNGSFVTMETVTFSIRSSEKYLFGFNYLNYVVKTEVFKKEQLYVNISYLLQQHAKLF